MSHFCCAHPVAAEMRHLLPKRLKVGCLDQLTDCDCEKADSMFSNGSPRSPRSPATYSPIRSYLDETRDIRDSSVEGYLEDTKARLARLHEMNLLLKASSISPPEAEQRKGSPVIDELGTSEEVEPFQLDRTSVTNGKIIHDDG